ncbi:NAD(P)-binding protein [Actinomadura verrucosospora]|uniref:FAD-binding monooxygenase, PheA/TfdB family n=1 Tax=Actinomadura verrucosospora TaxID=46165 RepID=A0A7D3W200_ACTVE|nr:NAD(P)-binding protein [Actinomadura verrucosospora]QKG27218.1 FAD-binding monooxygenase, PheA/TfdB family [Actinomadura verrucosospora]
MPGNRVTVLLAGAGATGLTCAAFLADQKVTCLLVERHPDQLTGRAGTAWTQAAQTLDVTTHHLGIESLAAHGIGADGGLLVRPDGVVARRSTGKAPADLSKQAPDPARSLA